jgi:predicted TIM-barrel fold metal-dependent hydrolase
VVVDVHCHVGHGRIWGQSQEQLLREMDRASVDMAVICPVDYQIAVANREGNDAVLAACRAHPDRFRGLAVSNPWYGELAVEELKRALGQGLAGLKIHASRQGHYINDPILDPLIREVEARQGLVYLHTGTAEYSLPLEAIDLARRFPLVPFILGHAGLVDVYWRHCWEVLRSCPNTLVETSHVTFTGVFRQPIEELGASRFVFGSDSPVGSMSLERWKLERMGLPGIEKILGENAQHLLSRKRSL